MRLDVYITKTFDNCSRTKAQKIIEEERAIVNGEIVTKPSFEVNENSTVKILASKDTEFVGRGGLKLEHAFKIFELDASDKIALDIGASTGGFTQCLLMHGANVVYAVDSGKNQLAKELLSDERVISIEGFNARGLSVDDLDNKYMDMVVMDVSFISQKLLYPAILRVSKKGADVVTLIKPQFEAGKQYIGKKGIVKDEKVRKSVVNEIIEYAKSLGFEYINHTDSPITGGDGNHEFLLHLRVK